jgi:hypothetical protein
LDALGVDYGAVLSVKMWAWKQIHLMGLTERKEKQWRFVLRTNEMIVRLGGPREAHVSEARHGAPGTRGCGGADC